MLRTPKNVYYLRIASEVARRGTCLRRNFGAVVVKNDEIISTGYTGAPRGTKNCCDLGYCKRQKLNVPRGERYELCRSVHAEQNALLSASRQEAQDATLYLFGWEAESEKPLKDPEPCLLCRRMIINMGVSQVITPVFDEAGEIAGSNTTYPKDWLEEE